MTIRACAVMHDEARTGTAFAPSADANDVVRKQVRHHDARLVKWK
jgi:hypothetical protein